MIDIIVGVLMISVSISALVMKILCLKDLIEIDKYLREKSKKCEDKISTHSEEIPEWVEEFIDDYMIESVHGKPKG
jgi:peptidoglycan hydrolase CwlO-like protein